MSEPTTIEEARESLAQLRVALAAAQGRLRLLSAHTSGIIFELDGRGRFVRVWASDPGLLARRESDLVGHTVSEALGPELGGMHDTAVQKALESGVGYEYEYELEVPTGVRHFVASSVVVPAAVNSTERAVIVWIRDTTEQVRTRARLLQQERFAALGRLAGEVAHAINNPLGYMLLNVTRMQRQIAALSKQMPKTASPLLLEMEAARALVAEGSERVRRIVRELMNFARIEEPPKRVELARAVALALDLAGAEEQARVSVVREFGSAPEVMVDEGRLVQVFLNLIDNGVDAILQQPQAVAASGEIRVRTFVNERGQAVAEVRDTGVGIKRELLERVFDPFYTTKPEGIGLGLTLCQTLVTSFAGDLTLESELGKGTTCRITLPAASPRLSENPLPGG